MPRRKELSQKQRDFFYYYTNPTSETYDNATQSAIKAGYKESYAKAEVYKKLVPIVTKHNKKLVEAEDEANARRIRILNQAEANLEEYVRLEPQDAVDKKIKADITKFASERLGKDHYSTRTESVNSSIQLLTVDAREALEAQLRMYLPASQHTPRIHEHDDMA